MLPLTRPSFQPTFPISAHGYGCALTSLRLTTITAGSVVDAAHMHQFDDSRNNEPQNGIALCKNAHWCFDQGLWSLTDDCRVLVGIDRFDGASPDGKSMASYHGLKIRLPTDSRMHPSPVHLSWHRRKHKYDLGSATQSCNALEATRAPIPTTRIKIWEAENAGSPVAQGARPSKLHRSAFLSRNQSNTLLLGRWAGVFRDIQEVSRKSLKPLQ